ncbi:MAG TPA: hypothetical protein VEV62_11870 [Parafilimonas sp.]|jgi:hypothetical protein|nr:hypothetical protein [Parafilimonas sp.]
MRKKTKLTNNSMSKDSNIKSYSADTEEIAGNYSINTLNWLYIEKARFHRWWTDHPTKTMYRFTFSSNRITLTGWAPDKKNDNNDDYDKADLLELKPCNETETLKGSRLYLGNIKLSKNNNKAIDDLLTGTPSAQYVLFKPVNYSLDKDHIAYEVYLSSTNSPSGIIQTVIKVANADPSPPATRK